MVPRLFVIVGLGAALALAARDVDACSCGGPAERLLSPTAVDDAPLNTKVRIELPILMQHQLPSHARLVLRVHGGKDVDVTDRVAKQGDVELHELSPTTNLAPSTQYEVAMVDATKHPSTVVFGTFKTGTTADTVAPTFDQITYQPPVAVSGGLLVLSSCGTGATRARFESVTATDPGRPKAQLLYGVWLGDAAGKIDPAKPPTRVLQTWQKALTVGQTSICSSHDFPFPQTGFATIGIAVVDEAGNRSALRTFRIDVKASTP